MKGDDMKRNFRQLAAWKKAHVLTLEVVKCAGKIPLQVQEDLGNDICNSAMAIGGNIARGCALEDPEFRDSLEAAVMSVRDVQMQPYLLRDLGHLSEKETDRLAKMGEIVRDLLIEQIEKLRVPRS